MRVPNKKVHPILIEQVKRDIRKCGDKVIDSNTKEHDKPFWRRSLNQMSLILHYIEAWEKMPKENYENKIP